MPSRHCKKRHRTIVIQNSDKHQALQLGPSRNFKIFLQLSHMNISHMSKIANIAVAWQTFLGGCRASYHSFIVKDSY